MNDTLFKDFEKWVIMNQKLLSPNKKGGSSLFFVFSKKIICLKCLLHES